MNKKLADAAKAALTAPGFASQAGYCQKFARQVIQSVYGGKFDKYFAASAAETMANFKGSPYEVKDGTFELGDILYKGTKTSGKYGHVGIRIIGNLIAENSSAHTSDTDREARGTRSIAAFGPYEMVVRLS